MPGSSPSLPSLSALALVALFSVPLAEAQVSGASLGAPYPSAARGEAALAAWGDRLSVAAARSETTVAALEEVLRHDETAWLDDDGNLFFVDIPAERQDASPQFVATIPSSQAFLLHSRPGASRIIYLDFTGHHSVNNKWGHDIVFPPFNFEGSSASFSENELQSIIAHWQHIAEDYAPFDVDVTTEEPPLDRLIKSGGGDTQWGVRDVHTQATGGFGGGIGGVAYLNSFNDNQDNPVFTFNKGTINGSLSGSHEIGHSFGLHHDGNDSSSYHPGVGSGPTGWGPIMGAPFGKQLVQFNPGDYPNATNTEDDYAVIQQPTHGVQLLSDTVGGTPQSAQAVSPSCPDLGTIAIDGRIESPSDRDAFAFASPGGPVTISASPAVPGGNVDVRLELYGPAGTLLASADPTSDVTASLSLSLGAGTHTVVVDGTGKSGVYSDYGSIGVYSITISLPIASSFADAGGALAGATAPTLAGTGFACASTTVGLALAGAPANVPAHLTFGVGAANLPFLGGTLVPNVFAPGGGLVTLATNGAGALSLSAPLPGAVPSAVSVHFQFWVADAGGPQGFAASNAIELVLP